jgi:hypothetical protein
MYEILAENSLNENNDFLVNVVKIGLIQAPVVLDARQERQDCAKSAKAINKMPLLPITVLGALGALGEHPVWACLNNDKFSWNAEKRRGHREL